MSKKKKEKKESQQVVEEDVLDESMSELDLLKLENQKLSDEIVKLKNDYAMAYADTANTKKRLEKEFDSAKKYRIQTFALDILPVLDNLERAMNQSEKDSTGFKKGIDMIYQQLIYALEKEGVQEIEAIDKPFDSNYHQAIMSIKDDGVEPNIVVEVLQKGYKIKDRILRASMVKVSE